MSRAPGCSLVVVSVHDALEFLAGLMVEIIGQVVEALYEPFPEGIALGIPPEAGGQLLEHLTCQLEKLLLLIKRGGGLGLGLGLLLGLELAGERRPPCPAHYWLVVWLELELSVVVA